MRLIALSLVAVIAMGCTTGCTTLKDAKQGKGTGTSKIYDTPFDTVWTTLPGVITKLGPDVVSQDKEQGYILAQRGMTALSYGENIAVFVEKTPDAKTKVEVVSKRSFSPNITAANWEKRILDALDDALAPAKPAPPAK